MTLRARIDVDAIYHDAGTATFVVNSLSDHIISTPTVVAMTSATVGTSAVSVAGSGALNTLAIKNTGAGVLRVAGGVDVSPGRVAVLPVTATVTVSAPGGSGSYSAIWVG